MKTKLLILVPLAAWCILSCTDYSTFKQGTYDEWIKGKGLYVNAVFVSNAGLSLKIRNNSGFTLPITPIRTVGWFYRKSGSQPCDYIFGDFSKGPVIEVRLNVTMSDGQTYEIMANAKNPELKLRPGEEVGIMYNFWRSDKIREDNIPAKKLLLYIGPNESPRQESYLIKVSE